MADILSEVKAALGITGTYQDDTLTAYIKEIQEYMIDAGVHQSVANSDISAGVIARGVTDLWNYNGGGGKLSDYFYQRVSQLVYKIKSGKIIYFNEGDFGNSFLIHLCNIDLTKDETVIFKCGEIEKSYSSLQCDCILLTFTKEESEKLSKGTYKWIVKIKNYFAEVTAINDGILIVS